jgi:GntR family transcriptional regulator
MSLEVTHPPAIKARPTFSEKHGTLYAQVANVFRQRIRSGVWAAGVQLPTLGELEREFQVARVTLRQALNMLENEGMIWRRRGRGTFVSETAAPEWFRLSTSRRDIIHSLGGAWSRMLEVDPHESTPLLEEGDGTPVAAYRHMRRVHGRGERAYAVVDMYLDRSVYGRAPARFDSEMIIPVLEDLAEVEVGPLRQTLTFGAADREVAEGLGIPIGSPIGILRRVVCDDAGRVIYVGTVNYRGDMVKLEIGVSPPSEAQET